MVWIPKRGKGSRGGRMLWKEAWRKGIGIALLNLGVGLEMNGELGMNSWSVVTGLGWDISGNGDRER